MRAFFHHVSPALHVFHVASFFLAILLSWQLAIHVSWQFPCPGDSSLTIPHMSWQAVVWLYFNSMTLSKVGSWLLLVPPLRLVARATYGPPNRNIGNQNLRLVSSTRHGTTAMWIECSFVALRLFKLPLCLFEMSHGRAVDRSRIELGGFAQGPVCEPTNK